MEARCVHCISGFHEARLSINPSLVAVKGSWPWEQRTRAVLRLPLLSVAVAGPTARLGRGAWGASLRTVQHLVNRQPIHHVKYPAVMYYLSSENE